jgi:hypothetical protein
MTCIKSWSLLAGYGARPRVRQGTHGKPTIGRQDKSADLRRAYMVGGVEYFVHLTMTFRWRSGHIVQGIQSLDRRHRSSQGRSEP